jgi:hypothetical protein
MNTVVVKITGYGQNPMLAVVLAEIAQGLKAYGAIPLLIEGEPEEIFVDEPFKKEEMTYYVEDKKNA